MAQVFSFLSQIWKPCIEIAIFWYVYYVLLKFLRSTGALQALKGLLFVFLIFVVVHFLGLETIAKLMSYILPISVIGFLVIFQNELRRGLTRIGQNPIFKLFLKEEKLVDEIVKAVMALSKKKVGALVAVEREVGLRRFSESGVSLDGLVTFELLSTIFMPATPLHDGAVIIKGTRIDSAGCLFPLSQNPRISKTLGTRHRAALGLSEETDAVVIVVSEETGTVSLAEEGEFTRDVESGVLRERLMSLYKPPKQPTAQHSWLSFFLGDKKNASSR